ncbi:MAG: TonB-dependent receptor plug domain-containing protein, partial [Xanthomonadaceae bacterium]|nr:TonB-dependent receptor plug domain-containing protein [Xanthomonadaceae bacterium]
MPSMRPIRSCSWAVKAALLGAVACASTSAASIAYAAESVATRTVRVDIAPKNLEAALIELSSQADVQLVMSADEVRGLSTTGLSGEYSLEEALQRLLSGSGLTYKIAPGGTVSVVKVETPQPSATPARSSSPERSEARNAPREIGLEEIIVTAQKRTESAQDVPITMQALSAEELRDRGVASAAAVIAALPNLTSNATSDINVGFTIRGVGTNNYHGNVSRAVGIYQDEVSMSTPFSGVLGVYDVERVEVLRGPQNTLFGRNTTGGAINYISRQPRPGEGFDGYLEATYGRYAQRDM